MVDYGVYFLNEEEGYTHDEMLRLSALAKPAIEKAIESLYGITNPRYTIRTEKIEDENVKGIYKSLKIVTDVPNKVDNNGHSLESILRTMDVISPEARDQEMINDEGKSMYIVFNGIGFLGGPFIEGDKDAIKYTIMEGAKLGFKEPLQYTKPDPVKKKKVLAYQSASLTIA